MRFRRFRLETERLLMQISAHERVLARISEASPVLERGQKLLTI